MLNLIGSSRDSDDRERLPVYYHVNHAIREMIIVDDASSENDRTTMLEATERCAVCTLIFKGKNRTELLGQLSNYVCEHNLKLLCGVTYAQANMRKGTLIA